MSVSFLYMKKNHLPVGLTACGEMCSQCLDLKCFQFAPMEAFKKHKQAAYRQGARGQWCLEEKINIQLQFFAESSYLEL